MHDEPVEQKLDMLESKSTHKCKVTACQSLGRDIFSTGNGAFTFLAEVTREKAYHRCCTGHRRCVEVRKVEGGIGES